MKDLWRKPGDRNGKIHGLQWGHTEENRREQRVPCVKRPRSPGSLHRMRGSCGENLGSGIEMKGLRVVKSRMTEARGQKNSTGTEIPVEEIKGLSGPAAKSAAGEKGLSCEQLPQGGENSTENEKPVEKL